MTILKIASSYENIKRWDVTFSSPIHYNDHALYSMCITITEYSGEELKDHDSQFYGVPLNAKGKPYARCRERKKVYMHDADDWVAYKVLKKIGESSAANVFYHRFRAVTCHIGSVLNQRKKNSGLTAEEINEIEEAEIRMAEERLEATFNFGDDQ